MSDSARPRRPRLFLRFVGLILAFGLTIIAVWLIALGNSQQQLRLGVISGLWGALIGGMTFFGGRHAAATATGGEAGSFDLELRQNFALDLQREVSARRAYEQQLHEMVRREIETIQRVVGDQLGRLRDDVTALRGDLVDQVGGKIRLERIETTRVIGSDIEALQNEVRQLAGVRGQGATANDRAPEVVLGASGPIVRHPAAPVLPSAPGSIRTVEINGSVDSGPRESAAVQPVEVMAARGGPPVPPTQMPAPAPSAQPVTAGPPAPGPAGMASGFGPPTISYPPANPIEKPAMPPAPVVALAEAAPPLPPVPVAPPPVAPPPVAPPPVAAPAPPVPVSPPASAPPPAVQLAPPAAPALDVGAPNGSSLGHDPFAGLPRLSRFDDFDEGPPSAAPPAPPAPPSAPEWEGAAANGSSRHGTTDDREPEPEHESSGGRRRRAEGDSNDILARLLGNQG